MASFACSTCTDAQPFSHASTQFHSGLMTASALLTGCGLATIIAANYNNHTTSPGLISFTCVSIHVDARMYLYVDIIWVRMYIFRAKASHILSLDYW